MSTWPARRHNFASSLHDCGTADTHSPNETTRLAIIYRATRQNYPFAEGALCLWHHRYRRVYHYHSAAKRYSGDLLRSHLRRDTSGRNWTCSKSGKLLQVYRVHVYGTRKSVPYHNISSTARLQQCLLDGHDVFPIRDRALVPSVPVVLVSEVNEWAAYSSRQSTHYWSSRSSNAE